MAARPEVPVPSRPGARRGRGSRCRGGSRRERLRSAGVAGPDSPDNPDRHSARVAAVGRASGSRSVACSISRDSSARSARPSRSDGAVHLSGDRSPEEPGPAPSAAARTWPRANTSARRSGPAPSSTSGATNPSVPRRRGRGPRSRPCASPRSASHHRWTSACSTLPGETSPWTRPASCSAARAAAIWVPSSIAVADASGARAATSVSAPSRAHLRTRARSLVDGGAAAGADDGRGRSSDGSRGTSSTSTSSIRAGCDTVASTSASRRSRSWAARRDGSSRSARAVFSANTSWPGRRRARWTHVASPWPTRSSRT